MEARAVRNILEKLYQGTSVPSHEIAEIQNATIKLHSFLADVDVTGYYEMLDKIRDRLGLDGSRSHLIDHLLGIDYKVKKLQHLLIDLQLELHEAKKVKDQSIDVGLKDFAEGLIDTINSVGLKNVLAEPEAREVKEPTKNDLSVQISVYDQSYDLSCNGQTLTIPKSLNLLETFTASGKERMMMLALVEEKIGLNRKLPSADTVIAEMVSTMKDQRIKNEERKLFTHEQVNEWSDHRKARAMLKVVEAAQRDLAVTDDEIPEDEMIETLSIMEAMEIELKREIAR